ncbi:lauroyl-Kdo(2)-lipid IV(A) myristoyltransferase [Ferrimonas pelagia]|uniref:Lauroyl-Kdo(2)-lipid IV(A) myristoyltransferase n=1 Tax=Ferrimonas pelagia TaxID=1177826 RepID=A0ABP9F9L1_9GAMM
MTSPHSAQSYHVNFTLKMLAPVHWPAWLAVAVLAVLAFMPLPVRQWLAYGLVRPLKWLCRKPIRISRRNLSACYPHLSEKAREQILHRLLHCFACTVVGMGELALRRREYLAQRIEIQGIEHLDALRHARKPVVFLVPHMFALEYAAAGLAMTGLPMIGMVKHHRSPVFNWFACRQRLRFGGTLYHRNMGIGAIVRSLKQGNSLFYLPDQDHGKEQSEFAPFFSCQKATLPVISRIARCSGAEVVPLSVGFVGNKVQLQLDAPLQMEGMDKLAEAHLLNRQMERLISRHPDQYMWFLKILKSRPEGEAALY